MDDGSRRFRFEEDGPSPESSGDAPAETPAREEPAEPLGPKVAVSTEQRDPGEETKEITGEITGEVTDDIAEELTAAFPPAPSREIPESVMRHLSESAPELAEVLPHEVEPAALSIFEDPLQNKPTAPEAAPETVSVEVPPEAPSTPAKPIAKERKAKKKTARKKVTHKGKSRKKSSAKGRRKPSKKAAKGRAKGKKKGRKKTRA